MFKIIIKDDIVLILTEM